jgi:hypothetical protein
LKLERDFLKEILVYFNVVIFAAAIILLVINLDVISVIHAKESEWLPVQKFKTYSTIELSIIYVIIVLAILNVFFMSYNKTKAFRIYFISFTPIITLVFIFLLFLNPHSLILNPTGFPPTTFDGLEMGAIFMLLLLILLAIDSIILTYIEGFLTKYLITLTIIIGALLLSDFIHELGHIIFILIFGGQITEFYPFPVFLGGEFNAGYVGFTNVPSNLIPLVLLGGEIFQWILICVILLFLYFKPKYRQNLFILTLLFIGLLDFPLYVINNLFGLPHWFFLGSSNGDIMIFSELTGFPFWIMIIFAILQLSLTVFVVYLLFFRNKKEIQELIKN